MILGVAMVAEALLALWFGWSYFELATDDNALYTFTFLLLLYFAVFSVVSARERRAFWATLLSKALMAALLAGVVTGAILTHGFSGTQDAPLSARRWHSSWPTRRKW